MSDPAFQDKRKRFFDQFIAFRATTPAYRDDECTPAILAQSAFAAEGINTLREEHTLLRTEIPTKQELAVKLADFGFEFMEFRTYLCFWRFGPRCASGPDFYMQYSLKSKCFDLLGSPQEIADVKALIDGLYPSTHVQIDLAWRVDQYCVSTTPRLIEREENTKSSFYPFLDKPLEQYFTEYMASQASVLLLIGPPGTGKTSFLRSMVRYLKLKSLLAYNKDVLESPFLYQTVRSEGYDLLALEDADNFVMSRKDDNPFMATLLNDTQGVANASNMKIVISTNLSSVNKVDSALIRPGRCFGVLHFRELDQKEANRVWEDMGMVPRVYGSDKYWPLSVVLNPEQVTEAGESRKSRPMGFVPPSEPPSLKAA